MLQTKSKLFRSLNLKMLKFKGRDDAEENIVEDNLVQSLHQLCRTRGPHAGQMKVFGAQFKLSLLCMHNISY